MNSTIWLFSCLSLLFSSYSLYLNLLNDPDSIETTYLMLINLSLSYFFSDLLIKILLPEIGTTIHSVVYTITITSSISLFNLKMISYMTGKSVL